MCKHKLLNIQKKLIEVIPLIVSGICNKWSFYYKFGVTALLRNKTVITQNQSIQKRSLKYQYHTLQFLVE
jgi:hypothetical protein